MANKKITDLQLRGSIEDTLNLPADDTIQTYRITIAMIKAWILSASNVVTATIADLAVTTAKIAAGAVTDSKANFTIPTIQRFTSGSGTYTTPAGVKYIIVTITGGGGGGGGAGATNTNGGDGSASSFGTSLLIAGQGGGGRGVNTGSGGGQGGGNTGNTINSPAITVFDNTGAVGGNGSGSAYGAPNGADSFHGGGGRGASYFPNVAASAPTANSGSGGAAGFIDNNYSAGAGGAGSTIRAILTSPSPTYSYTVGAGGTAGTGTTRNGSAGAAGIIIIEEFYH